ncbi:MAG: hypothetical protein NC541_11325 [bacterium]|nr:hypothetical protein [bacterium]
MLKQIRIMCRLELSNLFGWNVLRFSGDGKQKRRAAFTTGSWVLVALLIAFYMGIMSYSLILMNCGSAVPVYLTVVCGLLLFVSGLLKAGGLLFRREGYEILCSLPLTKAAVVTGRLCRMYVENLALTLAVMLPGLAVYARYLRPGAGFYLAALAAVWAVPLLPMAGAALLGGVIAGIASGMRRRGLVTAGLSVLFVIGVLYGTARLSALEGNPDPELLQRMAETVTEVIGRIYPPAVWLGRALTKESPLWGLCWAAGSLAAFGGAAAGICVFFDGICRRLSRDSAKHDYRMGRQKANPLLTALWKREFRRYFSSGVYVTNTIIGPVLACVFSGVLLAGGKEALEGVLPGELGTGLLAPFALAAVLSMMMPACVSVSMEGKSWWILKSLPLSAKNILDGKLLMNLILVFPFWLVSEILLGLAFRPGPGELLWFLLIPAALTVFNCVFGLTVNLRFPVTEWDNEVAVVKQSISALIGGLGGLIPAFVGMVGAVLIPEEYSAVFPGAFCGAILLGAALLYRRNCKVDFGEL